MEEGHALAHTVQSRCMRDRGHVGISESDSHRAMVGDHLHVTGALGSLESLREWAGEVGHDMAWAEGGRLQQPLPSSGGVDEEGRDPHRSPQPTQGMPGGGLHDGGGLALGMTARPLKPGGFQPGILQVCRLLLSSHDCIFFPVPHSDDFPVAYLPALMQADADHHSCVAHLFAFPYAGGCGPPPSGDQAVAGRWPDAAARARLLCARVHAGSVQVRNQCFLAWGLYALRVNTLQSHTCSPTYLPPTIRFGLAVVNPLLGSAVAVQPTASPLAPAAAPGGSGLRGDPQAVRMQLYPEGMQLPYRGGVIVVQPLALTLAAGGPLQELCAGRGACWNARGDCRQDLWDNVTRWNLFDFRRQVACSHVMSLHTSLHTFTCTLLPQA